MNWDRTQTVIHSANRVRCEPGWRLDWNTPDHLKDCDLWFVWAGRGTMTLTGGQKLPLHPGVCLWMRPGRTYQARHDPQNRLGVTFIHFDLLRADRKLSLRELPPEVHDVPDVPWMDSTLRRVVAWTEEAKQVSALRFASETLLLAVLAGLVSTPQREDQAAESTSPLHRRKIHSLCADIRENISQVPPVAELAQANGFSVAHFSRVFRSVMGESPQSYIIGQRIRRACVLLTETSLGIGEIADELTYPDVYFFSRQFKEKVGRSPRTFRREQQQKPTSESRREV